MNVSVISRRIDFLDRGLTDVCLYRGSDDRVGRKMRYSVAYAFVGLISSWASPAMAYIDPGSGSAIMSAIIGLFVAVGLAIKTYWYKLKSLFGGTASRDKVDPDEDDNKTEDPQ
jgi:hypothetical protein